MFSQENRAIKRPGLGPPDVYVQKNDQKEDKLTDTVLKLGYTNELTCSDEFGTAKKEALYGLTQSQVIAYLNGIVNKKAEYNTLSDSSKKRPQLTKENFVLLTPNTKHKLFVEQWMSALANGSKALSSLSKKVPIFHKKEECLQALYDNAIPYPSASWYMKLAAAHSQTQNETKKAPRRQHNDPSQEWTLVMTKYMSDLLQKMIDHYGGGQSSVGSGFLTAGNQIDIDSVNRQWSYCDKLSLHMYQEGLIDRQEYLSWAIDLLESTKVTDDNILRIMLSLVYQYIKEIVKQYLLARKLAQFCGKKLLQMTNSSGYVSPRSSSPHVESPANSQQSNSAQLSVLITLSDIWSDYTQCNQHRSITYMVSSMMQSVVLGCPSALIWLNLGEGKSTFIQSGSPLDLLPCHPCTLPIAPSEDTTELRKTLRECEIEIARRSMAAELSWSSDKVQQSMTGFITGKLLSILDRLDRYNFDRADTSPAINHIYNEIISIWNEKTNNEPFTSLEPLVFLLCDWATTTNRLGDHRPLIVAKLLEKHQTELWNATDIESEEVDANGVPVEKEEDNIFHNILLEYLDKRAPVLEEDGQESNKRQFANCVALYAELIRLDLFSHDVYICTLISRGDLNQTPNPSTSSGSTNTTSTYHSQQAYEQRIGSSSMLKEILESEDSTQAYTQSLSQSISANTDFPTAASSTAISGSAENVQPVKQSRHLQYVTHFPIPQEEQFAHECSQRAVVLFGVGKGREGNKHHVKKISKDLQKLFGKKNSIDVSNAADAGRVKARSDEELEQLLSKFQSLAYYDQYCIASSSMEHIIEMYENFVAKSSTHVPLVEHTVFFLDLVESSLNITALISFCEKLIVRMEAVDYRIRELEVETRTPLLYGKYTQYITVYCVGVLRCHLPSLLLDPQACLHLFQGIIPTVQKLRVAAECSSAQRCILYFLYVLYQASNDLRESKTWADFENVTRQIQELLCVNLMPAMSSDTWNKTFMMDYFHNFNMYRFRFDAIFSRRMIDNRTSFVNNTIVHLCKLTTFESVNEVALMCSEFTAYCSHLSADWLGVLKALCCSSVKCGYTELLETLNVSQLTTRQLENIAVFCAVLIARHCFSLYDFLQVALLSLTRLVTNGEQGGESGARLALHILLRIFKADALLTNGLLKRSAYIKNSCDIHLLAAANRSIQLNPLLAVLKAIFMLADTAKFNKKVRDNDFAASLAEDITDEEDDEPEESRKLSVGRQAKQVLSDICCENWVREKFLLLNKEQLRDKYLESQGVWRLVQLICRGRSTADSEHDNIKDFGKQQSVITRILRSLDQWSIRVAWLELQLMHTWQNPNSMEGELSLLLDNIARATIEVFHSYTRIESEATSDTQKGGVWLVAPLIAKLPTDVQGRVLQSAALVLEKSNKLWQQTMHSSPPHQRQKDKERESSMSLLNHQPFLALVLTCLKGQDEQREGILSSLQSQLEKFVSCAVEDSLPTGLQHKQLMHEALQLRLSLIGGMFDTIQRTHSVTGDWAHILNKLICYGIVDVQTNSELFYTVLDMLSALIHSTLVSDSADSVENSKKPYHVLIKKIKKDIGDKHSDSLTLVKQLLPISKHCVEVTACESHSSILDAKGNKIQGFESISKKSGLQVSNKYKISAWELIEGLKNPTPLCWQWFGAVKLERKLLDQEEQHALLLRHNHQMMKAVEATDFLAPPILPPEEVDAPDVIDLHDDSSGIKTEQEGKAKQLASSVPVPKSSVGKVPTKRRTSRANSTTNKAAPYANIPAQPYDSRIPGGTWGAGPSRSMVPGGYPPHYPMTQNPPINRMIPSNSRAKEALGSSIRNRQNQAGMMMPHTTPRAQALAGYGMEVPTGPGGTNTKEQLKAMIMNNGRQKMGGGGSLEQFEPPPQYNASPQFGNRIPQGYMSQPPSYGAPTNAPQGGMMMGGGQQPHSNMMSYNAGQPPMGRYVQGGQPPNTQPPGGAYTTQYSQQYQPPENRMMQGAGQYVPRGAPHPQQGQGVPGQPPTQYTNMPANPYSFQ